MATGKTGIKRDGPLKQSDTNIKRMTMGHWTPRGQRNVAGSRSGAGGKCKRMWKIPPPGGWKPENFK